MPTKDHKRAQEKINLENLQAYRKDETHTREEVLSDFIFWLEYDYEEEIDKEHIKDLQSLIDKFIGYDIEKVKMAELTLLDKWKKSVG